jgi:hypothetical protein
MLFVTVYAFRGVLFSFLAFTGKLVSAAFDTFWGEIAKLSFMAEVLTSAAPKWATQPNVTCICSTVFLMSYRGKNREF